MQGSLFSAVLYRHATPLPPSHVAPSVFQGDSSIVLEGTSVAANLNIRTEIADAARFLSLQQEWGDLVRRAAEPNPFLHPIVVAAAAAETDATDAPVVLAWQGQCLVGVWALIRGRSRSGMPIRVLKAPIHPLLVNATPVIDSTVADGALSAMLDAIKSSEDLPRILSVSSCNSGGPVMAALQAACQAGARGLAVLRTGMRPQLACEQEPAAYFAQAMSGGRRRKLGQLRRRLATHGHLEMNVHRTEATVSESLERFMQIEAAGWKGASGTSFLGTEGAAFARGILPRLAQEGAAEIWELSLNGDAVSLAIVLRQNRTAFVWKITYNEKYSDCSPGVLLAQDYTTTFLTDDATGFADSCAADDAGLLGPLWTGRQGMVDLLLDARGTSASFRGLSAIEKGYANARQLTKKAISLTRGKLKRFS